MTHEALDRHSTIAEIVQRLSARYPDLPTATFLEVVSPAYDEFDDAHVRDLVEVLVETGPRSG